MTDLAAKARELLAAELSAERMNIQDRSPIQGGFICLRDKAALRAIEAALRLTGGEG
jgi:hypothetical protein